MINDNLLDPKVVFDPYSYFQKLREYDPVYWNKEWGGWILTRYDDVMQAFQDERLSSERMTSARSDEYESTFKVLSNWMVFNDPPRHTRLRKLVSQAFTPKATKKMEPSIETITNELLDQIDGAEIDILSDFANSLPILVISEMLGLPSEDRYMIKKWSDDLMLLIFGALDIPDRHERAQNSLHEMIAYLEDAIAERKKRPQEDLLTSIIFANNDGDLLTNEEIVSTCTLLAFGGHETTTNLIANGIYSLLMFPDQFQMLVENPSLARTAVEEFLRFESPSKAQVRIASEDCMIGDKKIKKGQRILLVQAAANRDPEIFTNPEQLDITRKHNQHLAFGKGIHFCLGAPLARLEGEIAIPKLIERFPQMKLKTTDLEWHATIINRGLKKLPITV